MNPDKWKQLSRKDLLKYGKLHIVEDTVELPDTSELHYWREAPSETHSVIVIAVNSAGEALLQQCYHYPSDKIMWQLPDGSIREGEDITGAANRVLEEYAGLNAKRCRLLGHYYMRHTRSDRQQAVVLSTNLVPHKAENDYSHSVRSHWFTKREIADKISADEFDNMNLLAALNLWLHQAHGSRGSQF